MLSCQIFCLRYIDMEANLQYNHHFLKYRHEYKMTHLLTQRVRMLVTITAVPASKAAGWGIKLPNFILAYLPKRKNFYFQHYSTTYWPIAYCLISFKTRKISSVKGRQEWGGHKVRHVSYVLWGTTLGRLFTIKYTILTPLFLQKLTSILFKTLVIRFSLLWPGWNCCVQVFTLATSTISSSCER